MSRRRRERESAEREGGRGPRKPAEERKDFLIQARVPRDLDDVLKREAKRRRLSVSHLIRNVLEDTYKLVDGVISEVDNLVQDSVELSDRVRRDVGEVSRAIREARAQAAAPSGSAGRQDAGSAAAEPIRAQSAPAHEPPLHAAPAPASTFEPSASAVAALARAEALAKFEAATADVYAWNPVVLHRPARCVRCMTKLERGQTGHLGLSQAPGASPRWLCSECVASL